MRQCDFRRVRSREAELFNVFAFLTEITFR